MKAEAFDEKFDKGDDILDMLDITKARRSMQDQKRVNVDFPAWMIESLDKEASRVGVTRQSIIKVWLAERLENLAANRVAGGISPPAPTPPGMRVRTRRFPRATEP